MKYCNINVIIKFVIHTFSGQVIVGGCKSGCIFKGILNSSIELFPRPPSKDCYIPDKPEAQLRRKKGAARSRVVDLLIQDLQLAIQLILEVLVQNKTFWWIFLKVNSDKNPCLSDSNRDNPFPDE